jgi:hypothetical protein
MPNELKPRTNLAKESTCIGRTKYFPVLGAEKFSRVATRSIRIFKQMNGAPSEKKTPLTSMTGIKGLIKINTASLGRSIEREAEIPMIRKSGETCIRFSSLTILNSLRPVSEPHPNRAIS